MTRDELRDKLLADMDRLLNSWLVPAEEKRLLGAARAVVAVDDDFVDAVLARLATQRGPNDDAE